MSKTQLWHNYAMSRPCQDWPGRRFDNSTHYILWSLLLAWTCIYILFPDWASTSGCPGAPAPAHLYHVSCLSLLSWLSLMCMCDLGLCPFSGLVYDLLLKSCRGLSPKAHCQKSISFHNCDVHWLEDTRVTWCLSYPIWGAPFLGRNVSS